MQALKAMGDIAGMMSLAQKSSASARQTGPGASAMDAMNKDAWDIGVKCLQDLEKVAYKTRLKYNATPK